MQRNNSRYQAVKFTKTSINLLSILVLMMLSWVAVAQTKVVVIPLMEDVDIDALASKVSSRLVVQRGACAPTACFDAPHNVSCPDGQVMVAINMPEFGGNEGSCNLDPDFGPDDFSVTCCEVVLVDQE